MFIAFTSLGTFVSERPPGALDVAARSWKGALTPLALFFTGLGLWYAIVPIAAGVLIAAALARDRFIVAAWWVVSQIISQGLVAEVKPFFARARPSDALGYRLNDYSFPSGHAVTSVVFYVALAYLISNDGNIPPAVRNGLIALLLICAAGICWSRIALGAHYATDVAGGLLFGCAWLSLLLALVPSWLREAAVARSSATG